MGGQNRRASPVGDGEGDEGRVSEGLQDEGLHIGQLGSVGEPGPPRPPNHCVCRAQRTREMKGPPRPGLGLCLKHFERGHYLPSSSWIFFCTLGLVTRYRRLQEMAVVTVSNPGQRRTEGEVRLLVGQGSWAQERQMG